MAAVGPGYDEIGAQTLVLTAKQQFRVGHPDVIGVSRIEVDYRRIDAVAAAAFSRRHLVCSPPVAGEPRYIALIQRLGQVKLA